MGNGKHNAKFFCENCGEEVPQNAKVCTKCGKFFTFTRCPNCFFTGESKLFTNGCPKCGYAINPYGGLVKPKTTPKSNPKKKKRSISLFRFGKKKNSSKNYESSLPAWVYVLTIALLLAVIFGLYSCL